MENALDIISALRRENWPRVPSKFEMSRPTLLAVKTYTMDHTDYSGLGPTAPALGTPVYVDESVPDGQARVTWPDGSTEYIGTAKNARSLPGEGSERAEEGEKR